MERYLRAVKDAIANRHTKSIKLPLAQEKSDKTEAVFDNVGALT